MFFPFTLNSFVIVNVMHLKNINQPLHLLIENEIFRLTVGANPSEMRQRPAWFDRAQYA
jgi:phosphatidylinositol 4-kinase